MDGSGRFYFKIEEIFQEYYAPLCFFVSRYVNDRVVTEDLVQDIFVTIIEKKITFSSKLHLRNYLYLTCKNSCLNYLRKGNTKLKYLSFHRPDEHFEEAVIHDIITTEVYKELSEAISQLPTQCRAVFEASYFEELDNNDVAKKLGISVFTVKAQKMRGKHILKKKLKDLFPILVSICKIV